MSNICIYCDESTHLPHDGHPYMVLGALCCPKDKVEEASRRIAEIRAKHGLPPRLEIKWTSVSPAKLEFYIDIVDYFLTMMIYLLGRSSRLKRDSPMIGSVKHMTIGTTR